MEEVEDSGKKSAKEVAAEVVSSWLHDLYLTHPLAVSQDQLKDLIKKGLVEDPSDRKVRESSEIISQQVESVISDHRYPLSIEEYIGRCPAEWHAEWRDREIKSKHWKPPSGDHFDQDFRDFISSTHQRFCDMKPYKAFFLYLMQARRWSSDSAMAEDYTPGYERERFQVTEISRFRANSMYFCNKYGHVKESGMGDKGRKYEATLAHAMILFLLDCGRCFLALKGRQMAFTSTVALWMVCRMITRPNYAIKFVAQDKDKTEEIFEDKVKHSFTVLDDWMKPRVVNNRDQWFRVSFISDSDKGGATNSSGIRVVAPKADAVNGGSPDFVGMDEQAYTPLFRKMLKEGRPALKVMDPQTKERRLTRQATAWTCVCAGTKVWTHDGRLINIEDIRKEDGIVGYDGASASMEPIASLYPPSEKPCYKIVTNTGRFIECSFDHPILWSHGKFSYSKKTDGRINRKKTKFVWAKDIKPGDQVAVITDVPFTGSRRMWQPRLVGWLIGDGYYGGESVRLSSCDEEINSYIYANFDCHKEDGHITALGKEYMDTRINGIQKNLRDLGIFKQSKLRKTLPKDVHTYCEQDVCEMLGGLFDTDGCVHYTGSKSARSVELCSMSYSLLDEVRMLLQRIGIECNISSRKPRVTLFSKGVAESYTLVISRAMSVLRFAEKISFSVGYKQDRLGIVVDHLLGKERNRKNRRGVKPNGLGFERVVSVEPIGDKLVYNLTAGKTHTYIANGIVTHNTGGEDDRGNGEFEDEYRSVLGHWNQACATGVHNDFFFPIFMDWTCIPGATVESYEKEKRAAAAGTSEGMADKSIEERMIIFRQQWPSSIEDGFLTNVPTLVPMATILKRLDDIDNLQVKLRTQYNAPIYQKGRFVPIFGERQMPDGMWYNKNVIGAQWVPSSDSGYKDPISILTGGHPKRNWKWRYYQGTDPVQHDGGHSLQSSFIWDAQWGMPIAACNGRYDDPNLMHEQVALMGMYYADEGQHFTPHLIENNMGTGYIDFVSSAFFERGKNSMVNNNRLPDFLQGGETDIGLRMTGRTKYEVVNRLKAIALDHGHKILFRSVWNQLQHFTQTHGGDVPKWKSSDPEKFPDDQLIALPLSYICRLCFHTRMPMETDLEKIKKDNQPPPLVLSRDSSGELDYVHKRACPTISA